VYRYQSRLRSPFELNQDVSGDLLGHPTESTGKVIREISFWVYELGSEGFRPYFDATRFFARRTEHTPRI